MTSSTQTRGILRSILFGIVFLSVAACSPIQPVRVTQFREGVESVRQQTATAFAAVNALATEDEIDYAAGQETLNDQCVPTLLAAADIAAWDHAFANIDTYAESLEKLLSPDVPKDFDDSVVALGTQLQSMKQPVPHGVAAGFAELGRVLIEIQAQHDAHKFAEQADPAVRRVLTLMAGAVPSLRSTVRAHWDDRLAKKTAAFSNAPKGSARRKIVVACVDIRDRRDAQDRALESLRLSFLSLAAAHTAMAKGDPIDLSSALATVKQELDQTKALYDQFKAPAK